MIYLSVCSRRENRPAEVSTLHDFVEGAPDGLEIALKVAYDAPSIYEGHQSNIDYFDKTYGIKRSDVFVFLHDDVEILSDYAEFATYVNMCRNPSVGFIGVAGAYELGQDAVWWNSRTVGKARGCVMQGTPENMHRNYFGKSGEVAVLDGCFMACAGDTIEIIGGIKKPKYLTSNWDFYDIGLTMDAHMKGLKNYVVPIMIRHVSNGEMREGWYSSRQQFILNYKIYLPRSPALSMKATDGLPC